MNKISEFSFFALVFLLIGLIASNYSYGQSGNSGDNTGTVEVTCKFLDITVTCLNPYVQLHPDYDPDGPFRPPSLSECNPLGWATVTTVNGTKNTMQFAVTGSIGESVKYSLVVNPKSGMPYDDVVLYAPSVSREDAFPSDPLPGEEMLLETPPGSGIVGTLLMQLTVSHVKIKYAPENEGTREFNCTLTVTYY